MAWVREGQRGYPARIRTLNNGTKIRCVTITPRGTRPANRRGVHRRQRAGCKGRLRIFWPWVSQAEKPWSRVPASAVGYPAACRGALPIPAGYRGRKRSAFALLGGLAEPVSTEGIAHAATLGGAAVAGGSGGRLLGGNSGFPFLLFEIRFGFHGEGDAVPLEIDFGDGDLDLLTDFDGLVGVLDEVVGELADVDEAILVDAYVDEGTEGGDVGDDAGEFHADGEVGWFFHAVGEGEGLELAAGVAAWFREFRHDVLEGGKTHIGADIFSEVDGFPPVFVADEVGHGAAGVRGHAFDESVAFRVDGGGVERVGGVADAEESGGLFEGLVAEPGDLAELGA